MSEKDTHGQWQKKQKHGGGYQTDRLDKYRSEEVDYLTATDKQFQEMQPSFVKQL